MSGGVEVLLTNPWVPVEWIAAHGFRTRGVWSGAGAAPAPVAEGVCAFAQMAQNQATGQGTLVIFTTGCDQMRRAADEAGGGKFEVRSPKSEVLPADARFRFKRTGTGELRTSDFELPSDLPSSFIGTARPSSFLFNLPATWQTPAARQLYHAEVARLGKFLQRLGGSTPTAAALKAAMLKHDELRAQLRQLVEQSSARAAAEAMAGFFGLDSEFGMGNAPAPGAVFRALAEDREAQQTNSTPEVRQSLPECGTRGAFRCARGGRAPQAEPRCGVPLALVGGPLCASQWGIFDAIESAGGRVVLNATEPGERCLLPALSAVCGAPASGPAAGAPITSLDALLTRLCDHYFDHIVDVFQRPNSRLYDWLGPRLAARGVRGIVLWVHVGCDLWRAEAASLREAFGLPVLVLDSPDVRGGGLRDLNRLAAFIESLHGVPASGPASLRHGENRAGPEAGAPAK